MSFPLNINTNFFNMATSIVETINPEKAQEYLNMSGGNRNISTPIVNSYALSMKQGKWMLNGEPIVFDIDGVLLNGHHRLHAIIKAGVPIQTFVTRGVEHESFTTFDCGRHRTVGQLIGMQGVKNYNTISSTITTSYKLANNLTVGEHTGVDKKLGQTNTMMIEMFNQDRDLFIDAGNFAVAVRARCNVLENSIVGGVTHYLVRCGHYDIEFVKEFFLNICSYDTCPNQTLNVLRKRICENKGAVKKLPRFIILALIIKGWNAYVSNKTIKILRYKPGVEEYPKFILKSQDE